MIKIAHIEKCPSALSHPKLTRSELDFVVDTRKYQHPAAFVAIPGSRVNPLDLIEGLLSQECPLVVYQDSPENCKKVADLSSRYPSTYFLAVSDSVTFLQELTHQHIQDWKKRSPKNTVFAISGSNGKTTHKEMLSHILKEILPGKVVATEKNNNNHLGVPLTILDVKAETEFLVLELGSNHPGEIKTLCDISSPNAGLTTNIGATHLEFFGDEEAVFLEEGYLYHSVKDNTSGKGFYLINVDDSYLKRFESTSGSIRYGTSPDAEARIEYGEHSTSIHYQGRVLSVENSQVSGKHNKLNLITCSFIARHFYPEKEQQILQAASSFVPTKNRSQWIEFDGRSVFLDAYNANPSSMRAALVGFKETLEQKGVALSSACVVLGDMNELGDSTPRYHQETGRLVKQLGFTHVYFVGRFAQFYLEGFPEAAGRSSAQAFKEEYRGHCLREHAVHFIKGSRSLQLESLFDIN